MVAQRNATNNGAAPRTQKTRGRFGMKEFIQGLAIGLLIGFIVCLVILH